MSIRGARTSPISDRRCPKAKVVKGGGSKSGCPSAVGILIFGSPVCTLADHNLGDLSLAHWSAVVPSIVDSAA